MKIIPSSTLRIQLNSRFTFKDLQEKLDYLKTLGMKGLYFSPIFKARKGSEHGYDITDFKEINPELGGYEEFLNTVKAFKENGFFILQDFVPNHMSFDADNHYLMNILELGEFSPFKTFYDINFNHHYPNLKGKLLVPILGTYYGAVLENQELKLNYDENGFSIRYYNFRLPLRIESYAKILESSDPSLLALHGHGVYLKTLVENNTDDILTQVDHAKKMIWQKYQEDSATRDFIDTQIKIINGEKGKKESFNKLDNLIFEQRFRLSYWKVAAEEINYRRFFTINDLIGIRVEDPDVFNILHTYLKKLMAENLIDGVRIDHIDGLYDPEIYLENLNKFIPDKFIVAEKILEKGERLPKKFNLDGTTGYDFLTYINNLFCQTKNEVKFDSIYQKFCGSKISYHELLLDKKRLIVSQHLQGNIESLAHYLKEVSGNGRLGRDLTYHSLRKAMIEIMLELSVYRTYINSESVSAIDEEIINKATERTLKRKPFLEYEVNFLKSVLTFNMDVAYEEDELKEKIKYFIMSFQQLTGPVMAKGLEDTVFYIYNRLISLNEVGGDPITFGLTQAKFHDFLKQRAKESPFTMNATSTHDTKMGEDGRCRLNVLSEIPIIWKEKVFSWHKINKKWRKPKSSSPDKNDEYRLYQVMLSSFRDEPFEKYYNRIQNYILKAIREAKVYTAWIRPDLEYENAFKEFIENIFNREENKEFWENFLSFKDYLSFYGYLNSLSMVTLKMTAPGIPDIYQGSECYNFSLVDPDNRENVDYGNLNKILHETFEMPLPEMLKKIGSGHLKIFITNKLLYLRAINESFWRTAHYFPLKVTGDFSPKIIASYRQNEQGKVVITICPLFLTNVITPGEFLMGEKLGNTTLNISHSKGKSFKNIFSSDIVTVQDNGELYLKDAMRNFPLAVLVQLDQE